MNSEEFTYLIENPKDLNSFKTDKLNEVINEFPYFQSARALQLKGLNNLNSFKYNQALKKTAAYTIDRKVLFEFITASNFSNKLTSEINPSEEIETIKENHVEEVHKKIIESFLTKPSIKKETIKNEEKLEPKLNIENKASNLLEIGKPIEFSNSEPHSFNQWMQLASQKPINREIKAPKKEEKAKNESKLSLIDKFIKTKPKIKPVDKNAVNQDVSHQSSSQNESLMTETLAKVYLEQKKYDNAIKAYRILSLKYPEKSGFFADRIKAIKILQRNKS